MKFTYIIIVFLVHFTSVAQYKSMFGVQKTEWTVVYCPDTCLADRYSAYGDTIFDGVNYKFLDGYHYNKNFLIREDTLNGKIYIRVRIEKEEHLVYDFSLQKGDSIDVKNPISPAPVSPGYFTVDSVSQIELNGKYRKILFLKKNKYDSIYTESYNKAIWIEGIGSTCLINTPGMYSDTFGVGVLSCYKIDDNIIYSGFKSTEFGCDMGQGVSDEKMEKPIKIYFSDGKYTVQNLMYHSITIKIVDVFGKLVKKIVLNDYFEKFELNQSEFSSGLYLLLVESKNHIYNNKIVIK